MSIVHRILVPTDFSEAANNALRYALELASVTHSEVKLLHVYNVPVVDPYMPGDTLEALLKEIKKEAERQLDLTMKAFPQTTSGECVLGFMADEVAEQATVIQADLIVMGTTGASGIKEVLFGSNASAVIEKAQVKVIAVPLEFTKAGAPSRICYASDFTDNEEVIFKTLDVLAKSWGAQVDVLHISGDDVVFTPEPASVLFEKHVNITGATSFRFHEIKSSDITAAIETYVQARGSDLLVMAMHRRNLFERIFHKSRTKAVAHHTSIPLLNIKKI